MLPGSGGAPHLGRVGEVWKGVEGRLARTERFVISTLTVVLMNSDLHVKDYL